MHYSHSPIIGKLEEPKKQWVLVSEDPLQEVGQGYTVKSFRGEPYLIAPGIGEPPHKPGSQGKVWVVRPGSEHIRPVMTEEYYPSVFGLKWIQV